MTALSLQMIYILIWTPSQVRGCPAPPGMSSNLFTKNPGQARVFVVGILDYFDRRNNRFFEFINKSIETASQQNVFITIKKITKPKIIFAANIKLDSFVRQVSAPCATAYKAIRYTGFSFLLPTIFAVSLFQFVHHVARYAIL